ncbi:cell division protein ZapA [Polycladidibacter hongkongensis]|uniref:cell division protein ZapA n=1 Tax=Polycladidibacter hongkongensis TaxID=1647556 RepID=UPI00082B1688|nr:cell division protein ZapA [Pseudovibrio hongkongensis]
MAQVTVTINGRTYRMACDDGEENRLHGLAGRFDESIDSLRSSFGEIGDLRLTVMAGIVATDQLAEAEKKISQLQEAQEALEARMATLQQAYAQSDAALAEKLDAASAQLVQLANDIANGQAAVTGDELDRSS